MKLHNTIVAGLGVSVCLSLAIAATTAQQTEERRPYTIHRVTGDDLSTNVDRAASQSQPSGPSQPVQAVPFDGAPRLSVLPGPQRVVVSEAVNARGDVPGVCGDTTVTQSNDPNTIGGGFGTLACAEGNVNVTVENAWARCFPGSDFPSDMVLQCIDTGIEQNTSPANNPFDVDLRIVQLVNTAAFPNNVCPIAPISFGNPQLGQTWFDLPPEFNLLHIQRVRVAANFEGILKIKLTKLVLIPAGTDILVELHASSRSMQDGGDGGGFRVGSNEANPPSDPLTYIWAPGCGILGYANFEVPAVGFNPDWVLRLDGSVGPINGICCRNLIGQGCDPVVTTFDNCNGPTDRFCPNAVACPTPDDPFCPSFEGPGSPPCPFIVANDDCDGLIILSGSVCEPFNTLIATNSGVINPVSFNTVNNDVFFGYIVKAVPPLPNTSGRLIVSTLGSLFDTSVAVYRVDSAVDIRIPAGRALVCADIAAGVGPNASPQAFGDDVQGSKGVDNRPTARVNPLTYLCIIDLASDVLPDDQFVIRVGSPFPGIGGPGVLNVDYQPTLPLPWNCCGRPGGRCCMANGDCVIVPALADCQALSGFFRNVTDFFFGRDPADLAADPILNLPALKEITCVGCKTLPCAPVGGACFNPIDLKATLLAKTGTAFGTVTRLIRNKLYYKYQIPAGCGAIEIDTCGSTDAQGGGGFDTFIEVFKWSPTYPFNCLNNILGGFGSGVNDPMNGDTDPARILTIGGRQMINDDCRFDDEPENVAAQGAAAAAPCYNNLQGAENDSCLCFPVGTGEGNNPGDWILICIGKLNPDRDASGVNSIDPVENPTFDPVLASLSIRCLAECFSCALDTTGFTIDLAEPELICTDPGAIGTNDGCNAVLATSSGGPVTNPQTTPIPTPAPNVPFYISGNSGIFDVPGVNGQLVQHSDNDWYELDLAQPAKLTWQLVRAEFTAQIAILKAGNPATSNLCNTTGFLLNTLTPCDDDTMDDLTIDVCAGRYYLMIRPRPPFKPVPCGTDSEYLCCVIVQPQKAVNCCPGDANNDGILDGTDIQQYVDTLTHPPAGGTGLRLGGCFERSFCQADTNLDGFLTVADVSQFVALLLSKNPCVPKPDQCIDSDRCQLPDNASIANGLVSSDLNPQSFDADASVPDDFRAADCFCPTASGSVTDVCWWGGYTDRDAIFQENGAGVDCLPTLGDNFTITYYTSIFDQDPSVQDFCPDQVKAGPFNVTPTRVATGNIIQLAFGDVAEYRYEASHPAVSLAAGECCWISIVNNTTGRCTWRWETSPFGNGRAIQQENRNQGNNVFPTIWNCALDRTDADIDLAFCLNILIGSNGCDAVATVLGQCCFVDGAVQQQCLVLTAGECAVNYDGLFAPDETCASPCPPVECVITCQAGDIREAEGCGFDKNGGCDDDVMNPPIVPLGAPVCEDPTVPGSGVPIVICGTANNVDQAGVDADWYSFTLADPSGEAKITLELEAQPDLIVQLRRAVPENTPQTDGCSEFLDQANSADGDCTPVPTSDFCLPNGEYLVRVLSSFTRTVPCDESAYRVTIKCSGQCCVIPDPCPPFAFDEQKGGPNIPPVPPHEFLANDGCNSPSNTFQLIPADMDPCNPTNPAPGGGGSVFCGTSWAENNTRDTDWWLLPTLTTSTVINISFRSEFPGIVRMIEVGDAPIGNQDDCLPKNLLFSQTFAASVNCGGPDGAVFAEFSECIPAGTWVVFVAPGLPDGSPVLNGTPPAVGRNDYQMRITCGATGCAGASGGR